MSIGSQFKGLDMEELIGKPLKAKDDAKIMFDQLITEYFQEVEFEKQKKIRNDQFDYTKENENPDEIIINKDINIDAPLHAIVPIPHLQIDPNYVEFDMEIKESKPDENS